MNIGQEENPSKLGATPEVRARLLAQRLPDDLCLAKILVPIREEGQRTLGDAIPDDRFVAGSRKVSGVIAKPPRS
jgi:hypothetical protein